MSRGGKKRALYACPVCENYNSDDNSEGLVECIVCTFVFCKNQTFCGSKHVGQAITCARYLQEASLDAGVSCSLATCPHCKKFQFEPVGIGCHAICKDPACLGEFCLRCGAKFPPGQASMHFCQQSFRTSYAGYRAVCRHEDCDHSCAGLNSRCGVHAQSGYQVKKFVAARAMRNRDRHNFVMLVAPSGGQLAPLQQRLRSLPLELTSLIASFI
jgi:hypothetical protein